MNQQWLLEIASNNDNFQLYQEENIWICVYKFIVMAVLYKAYPHRKNWKSALKEHIVLLLIKF